MVDKDKYADEMLTDEELDQVAGGYYNETAADSTFLSFFGLCKEYKESSIRFDSGTSKEEDVKAAWAKVGVRMEYHSDLEELSAWGTANNKYFINDVEVTRTGAMAHARSVLAPMIDKILGKS